MTPDDRSTAPKSRHACAAIVALALAATLQSAESGEIALPRPAAVALPARVIGVGPRRDVATIAEAARIARSGDIVEITAGEYVDDVAVFRQDRLVIRAVGGAVRLVSRAAVAQAKAIFVVQGDDVTIEGIEFAGARVADHNGAGIRHEGGRLVVRDCLFEDNEMGILTWNEPASELVIERSQFRRNGVAPGIQGSIGHQIYVGAIARFELTGSYVHDGATGHLVKSRARFTRIAYNRLVDGPLGRASYEVDLPNGGLALLVGNTIGQSARTENFTMVSFGEEGYRWPRNALYIVNNTLVDALVDRGVPLYAAPGADAIEAVNNLVVGHAGFACAHTTRCTANFAARPSDFAAAAAGDWRLAASSRLVGQGVDPGSAEGISLRPASEYVEAQEPRPVQSLPHFNPGAFQSLAN